MKQYKSVSVSIENRLYEEIEIKRGRVDRFRFIMDIVRDALRLGRAR